MGNIQREENGSLKNKIKKIKKFFKKNKSFFALALGLMLVLVIVVGIYRIITFDWKKKLADQMESVNDFFVGTEGKVTTLTEINLKDIFEISELSTASYTYNAIASIYAEDEASAKYHVAYNGTVVAGIDFSEIKIATDDVEKKVTIDLPACKIIETSVDYGSMEYIFIDKKAENETVSQEAYHACQKDLEKRAAADSHLLTMAKQNTESVVEALLSPWAKAHSGYEIVIQQEENTP